MEKKQYEAELGEEEIKLAPPKRIEKAKVEKPKPVWLGWKESGRSDKYVTFDLPHPRRGWKSVPVEEVERWERQK